MTVGRRAATWALGTPKARLLLPVTVAQMMTVRAACRERSVGPEAGQVQDAK